MSKWLDPPDAGRKKVEHRHRRWRRSVLRNRLVLMIALQMATAIVKLVRIIYSMFNNS